MIGFYHFLMLSNISPTVSSLYLPQLRNFGQYQVLFLAESEEILLAQIREVPVAEYNTQRRRLALAEAPRQQKRRLHRNPVSTIQALVDQHTELLTVLESQPLEY